ncbi:MAG: motility protein A [Ferrovibrio sp.]|jgi:chemotaxis protein MotA|uniref:motility protein A n=1 Tax=Ferrovibrio sp. TaxID=1917215 RepID=UPI0039190988
MPSPRNPSRQTINSTIIGLVITAALVGFILFGSKSSASAYWDPGSLAIVLGGTVAAAFLSFRSAQLASIGRSLLAIFREEPPLGREVDILEQVALALQRHQLPQAEKIANSLNNPFLRLGLQLVIDRVSIEDVHHLLSWRIQKMVERETAEAKLFRTMAEFAPAFGMLGTLVGLVAMLGELGGGNLNAIGEGMALALITTVYGVILANLVFRPIAIKLEQRTAQRVAKLNMLLEGVSLLALGRGPTMVREAMNSFMRDYRDEIHG